MVVIPLVLWIANTQCMLAILTSHLFSFAVLKMWLCGEAAINNGNQPSLHLLGIHLYAQLGRYKVVQLSVACAKIAAATMESGCATTAGTAIASAALSHTTQVMELPCYTSAGMASIRFVLLTSKNHSFLI